MRKVKAKQLRQLALRLYDAGIPENTPRRIYRQLKQLYKQHMIPKDLRFEVA